MVLVTAIIKHNATQRSERRLFVEKIRGIVMRSLNALESCEKMMSEDAIITEFQEANSWNNKDVIVKVEGKTIAYDTPIATRIASELNTLFNEKRKEQGLKEFVNGIVSINGTKGFAAF